MWVWPADQKMNASMLAHSHGGRRHGQGLISGRGVSPRYVQHREYVMVAARLGCLLCALPCSRSAAAAPLAGGRAPGLAWAGALLGDWAAALLGDVLAAALLLVHLPIGFQVRVTALSLPCAVGCLHLPSREEHSLGVRSYH